MKRNVLFVATLFAAGSLFAADPKDTVTAAAKKLADGGNYSWKQTVDRGGGGGGFGGGGPQSRKARPQPASRGHKLRDSPSAAAMPLPPRNA